MVFRFLAGQRAVIGLIVAVALVSAGVAAIGAWLPALLMRNHAMSLGRAGLLADRFARHGPTRRLWFCAAMALVAAPAVDTAREQKVI